MSAEFGERVRAAMSVLAEVVADRSRLDELPLDERTRLLQLAGDVYEPDVERRRRQVKAQRRAAKAERARRDQRQLATTGIRELRARPVFTTPDAFAPSEVPVDDVVDGDWLGEAVDPQHCYVCKRRYTLIHAFYDQLCPDCAAFNFAKRSETADLSGRVALLTGGRVKIGYQAGIKLLRAGAHLIVTTRFPRDAALRYTAEPDAQEWNHRLEVFGLDLRHTPSVEGFCRHLLDTRDRLDIIVNNACQTVRRPPAFYRHMMELEAAALDALTPAAQRVLGAYEGLRAQDVASGAARSLPEPRAVVVDPELPHPAALSGGRVDPLAGLTRAAALSQEPLLLDDDVSERLFPVGRLDQDLQQVDLRDHNSWRLTLAEVSSVEMLETQLVNAVAPFVLNAKLKPLLLRAPGRDQHIVNVSAVEGQFYRRLKTTRHPHTNMAKAALNMMTRTSAADYQADGIHMNSVDTGWVSDEDPAHIAARKTAEQHFHPPLDIVDGAARILDPIFTGHNTGVHVWGQFLKDYQPTDW